MRRYFRCSWKRIIVLFNPVITITCLVMSLSWKQLSNADVIDSLLSATTPKCFSYLLSGANMFQSITYIGLLYIHHIVENENYLWHSKANGNTRAITYFCHVQQSNRPVRNFLYCP
ncbi:uncharacterized protein GGS25DRAFT_442155 [Hypoxylon fragiforme]|uniref:uncharacterized protein n=1 Tax=Hypoxylon fragiforme TaxID=63214 RepID=UPI0020C723E4|nr:uncharacterized protein GGS25DRAFT_442155 [Hypoxylon fragiforme]KAI2603938.1 hypothetical protein GGS25DRAFT_442155 [Hypoxylon fragiforme]